MGQAPGQRLGLRLRIVSQELDYLGHLAYGRCTDPSFPVLQGLNMNAQMLSDRALQEAKLQSAIPDVLTDCM